MKNLGQNIQVVFTITNDNVTTYDVYKAFEAKGIDIEELGEEDVFVFEANLKVSPSTALILPNLSGSAFEEWLKAYLNVILADVIYDGEGLIEVEEIRDYFR